MSLHQSGSTNPSNMKPTPLQQSRLDTMNGVHDLVVAIQIQRVQEALAEAVQEREWQIEHLEWCVAQGREIPVPDTSIFRKIKTLQKHLGTLLTQFTKEIHA